MIEFQTFIGGIFDTNGYLVRGPEGNILVDAPNGVTDWLVSQGVTPDLLLITHGHFDHIEDAAEIKRRFGSQVAYHPDSIPLLTDPSITKKLGFPLEIEPVAADFLVSEGTVLDRCGIRFSILDTPGHCPGSISFFEPKENLLFSGDVLFAGGIGRTDMPGGDQLLLTQIIRTKLYTLPDATLVLPGHGPQTTVGREKRSNPFVR
ncbi:MAG: MBL fold metallo-hydrolase [Verrucomicrobia bacterium]|nr:MBL fold metallo-hydrolase [Verrucomicrobiota bacterium]MBV9673364.1 MBL fold metallo-hydrolase [Verrucomicrobiota bacterium]